MADIDFLPASYRQMTVHRKANVWRVLAGALFVAMIGSSAIYQQILHRHELRTLASTNSLYDRAQSLVAQQLELKRQLQSAGYEAELFTYLRHPWPTTQLLNAALSPLPDRVTLHEIHLYSGDAAPISTALSKSEPTKTPADTVPAAKRDFDGLCQENDSRPRFLVLDGVTTDTAVLQRYVLTLNRSTLFAKAELISLEADTANPTATTHFTARVNVRPGYGQANGPRPTDDMRSSKESKSAIATPTVSSNTEVAATSKSNP